MPARVAPGHRRIKLRRGTAIAIRAIVASAREAAMQKLKLGLIGGGEGSQIGGTHRIAAGLDGQFAFTAGALDIDPARGRDFAIRLGITEDRAYGDWRQMLAGERARPDR